MNIITQPAETDNERRARRLRVGIPRFRDILLRELDGLVSEIFSAPDPQGVLNEIGTDAHEVFIAFGSISDFAGTFLTTAEDQEGLAKLAGTVAKVTEHTVNPDGTVTLVVPEPEES
jgi:hypothetical protein